MDLRWDCVFADWRFLLMKPLTIIFEIDWADYGQGPCLWKPGKFKARFSDGHFVRFWWLIFAVAFVRMSLHDYNRYVEGGNTEWRIHGE
jgi:hypothetical protein